MISLARNSLKDPQIWISGPNNDFFLLRYWGTPIPLWISDDREEMVCVGSIEELESLSGVKVERNGEKDLHRETVDNIEIPSKRPGQ